MSTKKEKDFAYYREKYGEQHYMFTFEWKAGDDRHIANIPANSVKEAFPRVLVLLKHFRQDVNYKRLNKAKEKGLLNKLLIVKKRKLESPTIYMPPS